MYDFDKTKRLLGKAAFDEVFSNANRLTNAEFVILHKKNQYSHARLGLVISKKKIAKASRRNQVKRLLRESFRLHPLPGIDLIFLARHSLKNVHNADIFNHLEQAWDALTAFYSQH